MMSINTGLFRIINSLAGNFKGLDSVIIFCANYLIYIIFAVALAIVGYLVYKREWKTALWFFGSLVTSFVILKIAQHIYPGVRPFVAEHGVVQLIKHAPGTSFPSDHTTVAAAIAFGILFLTRFKATGWLLLLGAVIVGVARIAAGVHYPFDILAGLATGLVGSGILAIVRRRMTPPSQAMSFDDHTTFKS
jgi:undecaprenyl-diphosphatase